MNLGWGIFTYGLLIDLMDEITNEPDLVDTYFEDMLTIFGLIIITVGFYHAVTGYNRLHKKLKQTNKSKDMFTDTMRHDLLNPAGIIKGYIHLLKQKEGDEKKLYLLQKVEISNEKIIQIVENASKVARLDSIENMKFESIDISQNLKEVVGDYRQNLDVKNIDVEFKFNNECKYVAPIDPVIYDAFSNLLYNAIKYNNESEKNNHIHT
ncbi:MAG: sensor histidine kinase [Methanohalobium sp.]|uniref:sensor histidine kinase n=1 Tax=Methanohalobium sp. TaxID=2837493 RepID=UPI00397BCC61